MGSELRHWMVAGGVVAVDGQVLLVQNRRRNGDTDWSTPGGVVDPGETVLDGLTREVQEETGLVVTEWSPILYRVHVSSPDFGFDLKVEAYRSREHHGELVLDDPDGIVIDHCFVASSEVRQVMNGAARFVSEPLLAHLEEGVTDGRTFAYRLDASEGGREVVPLSVY